MLTGRAVQSIHPMLLIFDRIFLGFHYLTSVTDATGQALLRAAIKNYKYVMVIMPST